MRTIQLVSQTFSPQVWNRAIIVFTFADDLKPHWYPLYLSNRTDLIRREIAKYTGLRAAKKIPAVAVANDQDTHKPQRLPDGQSWLGSLYTEVFTRISVEGAVPFYLATVSRVVLDKEQEKKVTIDRIALDKAQEKKVEERVQEIPLLSKICTAASKLAKKVKSAISSIFRRFTSN